MIKDNSAYLIRQIKKATEEKIDSLRADYKLALADLKNTYKSTKSVELKQLEHSLEKQREDFSIQQENMIALQQDHDALVAVSDVVTQVTAAVRKELLKPAMVKEIVASLGKVTSVQVPKGVKFAGATTRSDNKFVGTYKSGSEIEFDIDEFLEEQKGLIYSCVREQL